MDNVSEIIDELFDKYRTIDLDDVQDDDTIAGDRTADMCIDRYDVNRKGGLILNPYCKDGGTEKFVRKVLAVEKIDVDERTLKKILTWLHMYYDMSKECHTVNIIDFVMMCVEAQVLVRGQRDYSLARL
jgi:hypothetical protein